VFEVGRIMSAEDLGRRLVGEVKVQRLDEVSVFFLSFRTATCLFLYHYVLKHRKRRINPH